VSEIKKWIYILIGVLVVAGAAVGVIVTIGCGEEVATTSPRSTVETWVRALTAKDSETLASLHIPEQRDVQGAAYAGWSSGVEAVEFSTSNLNVEIISQTEDKAEVTAEYDIQARLIRNKFLNKVKFSLENRNGEWLISGLYGFGIEGLRQSIELLVCNMENNPIGGVEVVIYTAAGMKTGVTDDEGMVIFEYVPMPHNIRATKEGYELVYWGFAAGEPYKVELRPAP